MKIFDTHFHLPEASEKSFQQFDDMIRQDLQESLTALSLSDTPFELALLAAGGEYPESCRAAEYASTHDQVWFSCGVHPHQAANHLADPQDFSIFKSHPSLVAIGEIGLDYFYEKAPVAE